MALLNYNGMHTPASTAWQHRAVIEVYKALNGLSPKTCNVSHTKIIIVINAFFRKMVQTMSPAGDFQWVIYKKEKVIKYTIYICTFG